MLADRQDATGIITLKAGPQTHSQTYFLFPGREMPFLGDFR